MTTPCIAVTAPPGRAIAAAAVTLAWHLVLFAAVSGLPPLAPDSFPDLDGPSSTWSPCWGRSPS